jgi:hypothetical protein
MRMVGTASDRALDVHAPSPPTSSEGFVQVVVGTPATLPSSHVDIVMGGAVIRVCSGFDAGLLRDVVQALGAQA